MFKLLHYTVIHYHTASSQLADSHHHTPRARHLTRPDPATTSETLLYHPLSDNLTLCCTVVCCSYHSDKKQEERRKYSYERATCSATVFYFLLQNTCIYFATTRRAGTPPPADLRGLVDSRRIYPQSTMSSTMTTLLSLNISAAALGCSLRESTSLPRPLS